jgi:DNA-binding PadR family transcriptional regulator
MTDDQSGQDRDQSQDQDQNRERDREQDRQEDHSDAEVLREQLRLLREESRRVQQEAAQRERDLKRQLQEEAREREREFKDFYRNQRREERGDHRDHRGDRGDRGERGDHRAERGERGDRGDRGDRRGGGRGRGGPGWPGGRIGPTIPPFAPPMPPMPPMPPGGPLPPISGAGGTFTPYDILGGLGAMFGAGPGPAGRRRHGGRSRAGRGDVRITVLILLDEGPANGYQLMQEIEKRTNGGWKPSSGSVYPALQQLEDEGIVQTTEGEGRKMFALTEQGQQYVNEHRAEWTAPWEGVEEDEGATEEAAKIRDVIVQLAMAYMQVIQVGTDSQRAEAARVLVGARQALYRILAGDSSEQ